MGSVALVLGGARSGKSTFAEGLARSRGDRVVFVATAEACDAEMADRIERHRAERTAGWMTVEAPRDLLSTVLAIPPDTDAVLIDCLSVWASNRLLSLGDSDQASWWSRLAGLEAALTEEAQAVIRLASDSRWDLVLVSNEVGFGVVPPTGLGRAYRDLLGRLNQAVAARATAVFLVVAGLAIDFKQIAITPNTWQR